MYAKEHKRAAERIEPHTKKVPVVAQIVLIVHQCPPTAAHAITSHVTFSRATVATLESTCAAELYTVIPSPGSLTDSAQGAGSDL